MILINYPLMTGLPVDISQLYSRPTKILTLTWPSHIGLEVLIAQLSKHQTNKS